MFKKSDVVYAPNIVIQRNGASSSFFDPSPSTVSYLPAGQCPAPSEYTRKIRIVHISDTHKKHDRLSFLSSVTADVLIHSGDFSKRSSGQDLWDTCESLDTFFASLTNIPHKVLVAGNSEIGFNPLTREDISALFPKSKVCYLQDRGVQLCGLNFHGSPWTSSCNMGFSARRSIRQKYWDAIPAGTDVLVTHMAPFNILDLARTTHANLSNCDACGKLHPFRSHWGCDGLLTAVVKRVRPAVHCFGHIHESYGWTEREGVMFVNAAQWETWKPIVFDIFLQEDDKKKQNKKKMNEAKGKEEAEDDAEGEEAKLEEEKSEQKSRESASSASNSAASSSASTASSAKSASHTTSKSFFSSLFRLK